MFILATRPLTKEDNAIYASLSGLAVIAGSQANAAVESTIAAALAADKHIDPRQTFAAVVVAKIEYWEDHGDEDCLEAVY